MTNIDRFKFELNFKEYYPNSNEIYSDILEENGLDPFEHYNKANDRVKMLEAVATILQTLANDIDTFRKVETEFATTTAAYQYLQKRLADLQKEIDRLKLENNTATSNVHYMFFNA